jgi:hypothetical protein
MKMMAQSSQALSGAVPVAAAQPMTGGRAPARPPMTMFWAVQRFSQAV